MEDFSSNDTLSIRPIAIVSQVLQLVANMQHIDELFTWLASTMVERLGVVSVQVWAIQAYSTQILRSKLRASSSQYPSQAARVLESAEVRVFIERMLRDQRGVFSISVFRMFSQYQASVFAQQNCLHWTTYVLSKDVLLPPPQQNPERDETVTPLQVIFSFFTQKPLQSSDARAISFLLEQSLRIAVNQGLLSRSSMRSEKDSLLPLDHLIPERVEIIEVEQGENPFNSAMVIPEKRNREVYSLIDGRKNIEDLRSLMHIGRKEIVEALQVLLMKGYIRIREVEGNSADVSSFPQLI